MSEFEAGIRKRIEQMQKLNAAGTVVNGLPCSYEEAYSCGRTARIKEAGSPFMEGSFQDSMFLKGWLYEDTAQALIKANTRVVKTSMDTSVINKETREYLEEVYREGSRGRIAEKPCLYGGTAIEHSMYSKGWLMEDLRQALMKADPVYRKSQANRDIFPPAPTIPVLEFKGTPKGHNIPRPKHSHYFRPCPFDQIDVYRILYMFEIMDPCIQHAIKKLLVAGGRGSKDKARDVQDVIDTMTRWQAMRAEESPNENR